MQKIKLGQIFVHPLAFMVYLGAGLALLTQIDCDQGLTKSEQEKKLETALSQQIMRQSPDTRYVVKWFDLNQDGTKEAIVYVMSSKICQQDACQSFVFQWRDSEQAYRQISKGSLVTPPIRAVPDTTNGWYNLRWQDQQQNISEQQFNGLRYIKTQAVKPRLLFGDTPYGAQLISPQELQEHSVLLFDQHL